MTFHLEAGTGSAFPTCKFAKVEWRFNFEWPSILGRLVRKHRQNSVIVVGQPPGFSRGETALRRHSGKLRRKHKSYRNRFRQWTHQRLSARSKTSAQNRRTIDQQCLQRADGSLATEPGSTRHEAPRGRLQTGGRAP